jgi:hypothetical protein
MTRTVEVAGGGSEVRWPDIPCERQRLQPGAVCEGLVEKAPLDGIVGDPLRIVEDKGVPGHPVMPAEF